MTPPRPDPADHYRTYDAAELGDAEAEDGPAGSGPESSVTSQQMILAGRSDSLQAALASIALRIDALTSTTSTFRNLVSDRLTDYAEQVGRLASGAAGELDEYRRLHERSLDQIRRSVGDADDNLRKLSRSVGDLEAKVAALAAAVRDNGDAVDHLLSERDQVSDTLARNLDRVGRQVQGGVDQALEEITVSAGRLEEGLAELSDGQIGPAVERLDEIVGAVSDERERSIEAMGRLEEVVGALSDEQGRSVQAIGRVDEIVAALSDERERSIQAIGRLEQVGAAVNAAQERGLAKLASRLEARLDQIAAGLRGVAGDDLPAILTRLDARLRELSTELVTGRDRETAKALAQLSAQVDGVARLAVEERAGREQLEVRSSRLARAPAPPDLSEIHSRLDQLAETLAEFQPPDQSQIASRLDQLAETVARYQAPDLSDIHRHLDQLARTIARGGPPGVAPVASGDEQQELLDRFDQLGERLGDQLEALRRRIALRARPATQEFDEHAVAAIAEAVIARLSAIEPPGPARGGTEEPRSRRPR